MLTQFNLHPRFFYFFSSPQCLFLLAAILWTFGPGLSAFIVVTAVLVSSWLTSVSMAAPSSSSVKCSRLVFGCFTQLFGNRYLIDVPIQEFFDILKVPLLLFGNEGDGYAVIIGTRRTSDAVHIIFTVVWNVIVYHQTDVIDINTSRNDICSYQDIDTSSLKFVHHFFALCLL